MGKDGVNLLRGTLDLLVLRMLKVEPAHGYGIAKSIQELTEDALTVEEGSLYPSLYRMEKRGWIRSEWGTTDTGRRAKFYELTDEGEARLAAEQQNWDEFTTAVGKVLDPA